jgi:phage terminase large subunit GpA-like protein
VESLTYDGLKGSTNDVFVAPNPWKAGVMETFHGATTANTYFVRFYNVKDGDDLRIYDVGGNLVFEEWFLDAGSFDWNLVSRTRNQVSTGIYYWEVGDQTGKLAVIR